MVECHATSTLQGDVEEVQALKEFFNGGTTHCPDFVQVADRAHARSIRGKQPDPRNHGHEQRAFFRLL